MRSPAERTWSWRLDEKAISPPLPQLPPQPDQREDAYRQADEQGQDPQPQFRNAVNTGTEPKNAFSNSGFQQRGGARICSREGFSGPKTDYK